MPDIYVMNGDISMGILTVLGCVALGAFVWSFITELVKGLKK